MAWQTATATQGDSGLQTPQRRRPPRRLPPYARHLVLVGRHTYEVLTNRYDPYAYALVSSLSRPGYWIVTAAAGAYFCACEGFLFRDDCAHITARKLVTE